MKTVKDKISKKLFEIGALVILKNNEMLSEEQFFKLKKDIENEYFIKFRLDF